MSPHAKEQPYSGSNPHASAPAAEVNNSTQDADFPPQYEVALHHQAAPLLYSSTSLPVGQPVQHQQQHAPTYAQLPVGVPVQYTTTQQPAQYVMINGQRVQVVYAQPQQQVVYMSSPARVAQQPGSPVFLTPTSKLGAPLLQPVTPVSPARNLIPMGSRDFDQQWTDSIVADPGTWCLGCFAPCGAHYLIADARGDDAGMACFTSLCSVYCGCYPCYGAYQRGLTRDHLNLDNNGKWCGDCLLHCFCRPCALAQESAELDQRAVQRAAQARGPVQQQMHVR